jgi:ectoine hydroxylase-related dioxygenase (phytanoyl-CoA dioxygenase family)
MIDTAESLPGLGDEFKVSTAQVDEYRKNGHIVLRGVCTPIEIAQYRKHLVAGVNRMNNEKRRMEDRDTYGKAFLQIMNLWCTDAAIKQFVLADRFAKIAAQLMNVKGVRLYHDQALFKEPGGGRTPWHQDQQYWPLDTNNTITMWMPLHDITQTMGTMNFASGSHTVGYLGEMPISDESEAAFDKFVREKGYAVVNHGDMRGGDATFHSGWTLHSAPPNSTQNMREVMTIIYYPDGTRLLAPDSPSREADLKAWFPGQKPGELAASAINPLIHSAQ